MCGIGGFHIAPEVANTLFDDNTAYNLIVDALKANAHRGSDAAGFFAVEGRGTLMRKQDVKAETFITDVLPLLDLGKPYIAGVHTRAATKGKADVQINNHPVVWGDVLVTHNGMIHNDEELKRAVKFKEEPRPEVDSAAIAAVLNQAAIDPELEFEDVVKALSLLQGSFAIHAVWTSAPGYSLLARGQSSPLTMFYDNMGILLYSSELKGVKDLMKVLSLEGDVRALDPRTVVLFRDGIPVKWGSLIDPGETDVLTIRLTPGGEPWVESTRKQYYAAQGRPFTVKQDEHARMMVERGEVSASAAIVDFKDFANSALSTKALPSPIPSTSPMAALSEADAVFRFSTQSGLHDTISVWYGNVEVLVDDGGKLLDVFNWSSKYDRFQTIELEPETPVVGPFPKWFQDNTTLSQVYYNSTYRHPFQSGPGQTNNSNSSLGIANATKYKTSRPDGLPQALFENLGFIGISEVKNLIRSKREESLVFLLNERCPTHNQWLQNHHNPNDCEFVQIATLAALDKAPTITTMMAMTKGHTTLRTASLTGAPDACKIHSWWAEEKLDMPIRDGQLTRVHIPFRDKCKDCDFVRQVTVWPGAVSKYIETVAKGIRNNVT